MNEGVVVVLNAGSSSLKFSLYEGDTVLLSGQVDGIGVRPGVTARDRTGTKLAVPDLAAEPPATPAEALLALLPWLRKHLGGRQLLALGHRVVHGGQHHSRPRRVTPALIEELAVLSPLAPLHQPHNLSPIRAAVCDACCWLGLEIDAAANAAKAPAISRAGNRVAADVIPTDENLMIARHTRALLAGATE